MRSDWFVQTTRRVRRCQLLGNGEFMLAPVLDCQLCGVVRHLANDTDTWMKLIYGVRSDESVTDARFDCYAINSFRSTTNTLEPEERVKKNKKPNIGPRRLTLYVFSMLQSSSHYS